MIEGRSYDLKPYDIVLVKQGDIHRLTVDNSCPYERIIVYISPNFMNAYQTENYDLSYCFQKAAKEHSNVLRIHLSKKALCFVLSLSWSIRLRMAAMLPSFTDRLCFWNL